MEIWVSKWHFFLLRLNEMLLDGCLCEQEKQKILAKIAYHERKLHQRSQFVQ